VIAFIDRYFEVVKALKELGDIGSAKELGGMLGMSNQAISNVKTHTYCFSGEQIINTIKLFPKINERYLLRGESPMFLVEYGEKFSPASLMIEIGKLKIQRTESNIEIGELQNQLQSLFRENMELKTELAKARKQG
jgi:hypothetical protein